MTFVWRAVIVTLAALPLLAGGDVRAQELKVGAVYKNAVQLTKDWGGVFLPLPDGDWQLVAIEPSRDTDANVNLALLSGALVSLDLGSRNRVKSFVIFHLVSSDRSHGGWKGPGLCGDETLLHRQRLPVRQRADIRCWGVTSYDIRADPSAPRWYRDTRDWLDKNTANVPPLVVGVSFARASGRKLLEVSYFFNPEAEGHLRGGWTKELLELSAERAKYIEGLKGFGERMEPRVERGFAGKAP